LNRAPADPAVLSRLYLSAVLPCLTALAAHDPQAHEILGEARASIVLRIIAGPAATVRFRDGEVAWQDGTASGASVVLLFLGDRHLNAFFSGNRWAVPLPIWGGWRVALLARFSRLAARLEAIMDGHPEVLADVAGRRLHARLSLIAAGLGLHSLAAGDATAREALRHVPHGLASFTIAGEHNATVWFDHGSTDCVAGWGPPPRPSDVSIIFVDADTAYGAMREEIDTLAAVGAGRIKVDGLVPLADGLNFVMERLGVYLQN